MIADYEQVFYAKEENIMKIKLLAILSCILLCIIPVFVNAIEENNLLTMGDVDQNGIINIRDITKLQEYLVQEVVFTEQQKLCSDVNDDKEINTRDVTCIQRYCVGLDNYGSVGKLVNISENQPTTNSSVDNGEWLPGYFD